MATIDTVNTGRGAVAPEPRPVAPRPEPAQPKVGIQELAAKSEATRNETASEMQKLQERLQEAISTLNERMQSSQQSLSISVDKASKRFVVTVTDRNSGEVIRHIPGETALRVAHNIDALKGVLFEKDL
jgi:flagellar protein FlaG